MPSKKRKYNARFPAGRIKKIMQTDEEVGKVAQAVPIIISRTLELFVDSLLSKALQVTTSRNAKTLSPSHIKQCILAEARFDFLKDMVKNIPDVSAAEEKEIMSAENSPNASRFAEMTIPHRVTREDSSSSEPLDSRRPYTLEIDGTTQHKEVPRTLVSTDPIDLTKKQTKPNFYQETLNFDESPSVITINPTYNKPSTSHSPFPQRIETQKTQKKTEEPPILLNIDLTKLVPEIRVMDSPTSRDKKLNRQNSKQKIETKKIEEFKPISQPINVDHLNSGNLEIDEDYDT